MALKYSLVLLALTGTVLGQQIISHPSPAIGTQGRSASFRCEVDAASSSLEWYFGKTLVYYYDDGDEGYPQGQGDYLVEWEGQVSTFTINNLTAKHMGQYGCKVARQSAAYAELSVPGTALIQTVLSPPSPATGIQGESASFRCEIDSDNTNVEWMFGTTVVYYYDNGEEGYPQGQGDYLGERNGLVTTLTINNLAVKHAGQYGCKVEKESAEYAELIVLEEPSISQTTNNSLENSIAIFVCEANFNRSSDKTLIGYDHYPELTMFLGGTQLDGTVNERSNTVPETYYTFTMEYDLTLEASLDHNVMRCEISTRTPSASSSSETLVEVHYSVRNPGYTPNQPEYEVGQVINCTANGNPEPSFTWQNTVTGNSTADRCLHTTQEMTGLNVWECWVQNIVDGMPYTVKVDAEFSVVQIDEPGESGPESDYWKIAVGVAVPIGGIIIGAIVGLSVYVKKKKKGPYKSEGENNTREEDNKTNESKLHIVRENTSPEQTYRDHPPAAQSQKQEATAENQPSSSDESEEEEANQAPHGGLSDTSMQKKDDIGEDHDQNQTSLNGTGTGRNMSVDGSCNDIDDDGDGGETKLDKPTEDAS